MGLAKLVLVVLALSSSLLLIIDKAHGWTHADWLTLSTERAHTLSGYKQLVTSSTLSWARIEDILSGRIPTSRLVLVEGSAVCRVRDGNRQRAGRTDLSGSCIAGPGWVKHTEYQVLLDPFSLSRYSWLYWDMYTMPKIGTVAYNTDSYVGAFNRSTGTNIIGELDFNRGLNGNIKAYISENHTELSVEGAALVEIEPVSYRLESIKLNSERGTINERRVILGKTTLVRGPSDSVDWVSTQENIKYSVPVSVDWGHTPGTVKGLPASCSLYNHTVHFSWDIPWQGDQVGEKEVSGELQPATQMSATLIGVVVSGVVPFSGRLVQVYKDDQTTEANVAGDLNHTMLARVIIKYGEARYTESGKLAPKPPPKVTTSTEKQTTSPITSPPPPRASLRQETSPSPSAPTTLFPPTSSPTSTENPLRRFFPLEDDRDTGNGVAALFSGKQNGRSAGINSNCSNSFILLTSVFMLIFLSFE